MSWPRREPVAPEPPPDPPRRDRLGPRGRRALPFLAGAVAVLVALLVVRLVVPDRPGLTRADVDQQVASALASVTPAPALSAQVYQAVLPSLVIRAKHAGSDGNGETDLGSGVIVTDRGDILTSLHVVAKADTIELTTADGTTSTARSPASNPRTISP
jgi:S1-C subfamily serine protease